MLDVKRVASETIFFKMAVPADSRFASAAGEVSNFTGGNSAYLSMVLVLVADTA